MEQTGQQQEQAMREAICYRYKAVPMDNNLTGAESVQYEPWEFLTISGDYFIFRAENKGLAIPANLEMANELDARLKAVAKSKVQDE